MKDGHSNMLDFEDEPKDMEAGISIRHLRKVYRGWVSQSLDVLSRPPHPHHHTLTTTPYLHTSLSHSHYHTHTLTIIPYLHTCTITLSLSHPHYHTLTITLSHPHYHTLPSHLHHYTLTITLSLSYPHYHTLTPSLSHQPSYLHYHTTLSHPHHTSQRSPRWQWRTFPSPCTGTTSRPSWATMVLARPPPCPYSPACTRPPLGVPSSMDTASLQRWTRSEGALAYVPNTMCSSIHLLLGNICGSL